MNEKVKSIYKFTILSETREAKKKKRNNYSVFLFFSKRGTEITVKTASIKPKLQTLFLRGKQ